LCRLDFTAVEKEAFFNQVPVHTHILQNMMCICFFFF
jgi:hypothetical protein